MTEPIYEKSEKQILKFFITEEMAKNNFNPKKDIPGVSKKKMIFTCVFAVLTFAFLATYFFHFRKNVYLFESLNIAIYCIFMCRYNTVSYLIKEVKSRPDEEISYIVSGVLSGADNSRNPMVARWVVIAVSIVLPFFIFLKPHTMYENTDEGYYVRFYTKGVIQDAEVEIPDSYKGKSVVGIRGDVFANLQGVEKIILPDTITTIRGYAFAGSRDLVSVDMPSSLTYLGGGAFTDCISLEKVTLPYGITEVKGNTFENCISLREINIPEGVTRIGGYAFYNCSSLSEVVIPISLEEIGSSAFRRCTSLYEIDVPAEADVNSRAFKESPTTVNYCYYQIDPRKFTEEN